MWNLIEPEWVWSEWSDTNGCGLLSSKDLGFAGGEKFQSIACEGMLSRQHLASLGYIDVVPEIARSA